MEYLKYSTDPTVLRFTLNIIATFLDHGEEVTPLCKIYDEVFVKAVCPLYLENHEIGHVHGSVWIVELISL